MPTMTADYHIDTKEVIEDESLEIVKQIQDQTRGSKTARKLFDTTP